MEIPIATPSLNEIRSHRFARRDLSRRFLGECRLALLGRLPSEPMERARVTITRHGKGELDRDNLYGGVKVLLDVLRPMTYDAKTGKALHKRGLGVIRDDRPELCELVVEQVKIGRKDAPRTVIVVEEMPRVH